jgi:hypothetical protein
MILEMVKKNRQDVWSKQWKTADESDKVDERIQNEKKLDAKNRIKELMYLKSSKQVSIPAKEINTENLELDTEHIEQKKRDIDKNEAITWIKNSYFSVDAWDGAYTRSFLENGAAYVDNENMLIRTAYRRKDFTQNIIQALEVVKND